LLSLTLGSACHLLLHQPITENLRIP
jgi:hypothetical protein